MTSTVTEEQVLAAINEVLDPCTVAAGCPGGLVDMGLVRSLSVTDGPGGAVVEVVLSVTEPLCIIGHAFVPRVRDQLDRLDGVARVEVELDNDFGWSWSEDRMTPEYRARLEAHRASRRLAIGRPGTPRHF